MFEQQYPAVSVITPITKDREKFLPTLLRSFLNQTYPNKELILVSEAEIEFPAHPLIRLVSCAPGASVGQRRNIGAQSARGQVIVHFDSDDISGPGRIENNIQVMRQSERPVTGYCSILFWNLETEKAYKIRIQDHRWACGASFAYLKSYWQSNPFLDLNIGEDVEWMRRAQSKDAVFAVDGGTHLTALDHDNNTSPRDYDPWMYAEVQSDPVRRLVFPSKPKIALGTLIWNTADISVENVDALLVEKTRLEMAGFEVQVIAVDNGSTDGMGKELRKRKGQLVSTLNKENLGSSVARNQIIDKAQAWGADYLLFLDGDITVVPWSTLSMVQAMRRDNLDCLGAYWGGYSDDPAQVSKHWAVPIQPIRCDSIAPTQYGMWSRRLMEAVKFDENFGPGWAAEDDDYFLMMKDAGFLPYIFFDMTYLHRHIHHGHSRHGTNAYDLFYKRITYMIEKWKDRPDYKPYLDKIAQCRPPVVA